MRWFFIIIFACCLTACASGKKVYAPVHTASAIEPIPKTGLHSVKPNETLYAIAWRYGLDYRTLAKRNRLARPYQVETGEKIYLSSNRNLTSSKKKSIVKIAEKEPIQSVHQWRWPAKGAIIEAFSNSNKGINIAGNIGDPIYATAAGKVVYCGDGLRSYGNLIILKHNSSYLTAYAHNSRLLVKQGEWVKSGQKIAELGNTGTRRTMLHFEIRKGGQSVNPLLYLSKKN